LSEVLKRGARASFSILVSFIAPLPSCDGRRMRQIDYPRIRILSAGDADLIKIS
jgi:hypothetical protein